MIFLQSITRNVVLFCSEAFSLPLGDEDRPHGVA